MNHRITVQDANRPIYDIVLERDFTLIADELKEFITRDSKVCIVSDTIVSEFYLEPLGEEIRRCTDHVEHFIFPAGEESKTLDTVAMLYEQLIQSKFDRGDILIALGGGVVGDLTGYAAATFLRGIRFIQVPTSLLAMVDSSIGGKTGVDFLLYKNMVGAFYQPKAVYMNLSALLSLNEKQFFSGFGEIIKHGLIKDMEFYRWLRAHHEELIQRDLHRLDEMVYRSCLIKKEVVEQDPFEKGDRALLNFGHTIGHAIEKNLQFKMLHGECVSIGSIAASYLSFKRNYITAEEFSDIVETHKMFHLPVSISGISPFEILEVTKNDKKMEAGEIKFILLGQMGKAIIDKTVTDDELTAAINYILD